MSALKYFSKLFTVIAAMASPSSAEEFKYNDAGHLADGSGSGLQDGSVYFPNMRFPLEEAPAYLNSQVYGVGGSNGKSGSQCDIANYSYPWIDNFCESRGWSMPMCPAGKGHQGVDIRPSQCHADKYWAVAATDGIVAGIGSYSLTLQSSDGVLYRYLHMSDVQVKKLQRVRAGDRLGKVSNVFGGTKTTIHLHFDIKGPIAHNGQRSMVFLPPYSSLVASYQELLSITP